MRMLKIHALTPDGKITTRVPASSLPIILGYIQDNGYARITTFDGDIVSITAVAVAGVLAEGRTILLEDNRP